MIRLELDEAKMVDTIEKTARGSATPKRAAAPSLTPAAKARRSGGSIKAGKFEAKKSGLAKPLREPTRKRSPLPGVPSKGLAITYTHAEGVNEFVSRVAKATPMEIVEVERHGIDSIFLKDLSRAMDISARRMFDIVGIPKATAEKKVAAKEPIAGSSGHAALGLARLLAIAQAIVDNSTAAEAKNFDAARWLGQWIEYPQPALGGCKPADLVCTPTGLDMVARVLGAIESGAYQ